MTVACLALGGGARADILDGTITTLVAGRQDPRDGQLYSVVPVYQSLQLTLREVRMPYVEGLRVELSAWGAAFGGDPRDPHRFTGDLNVAYVEGWLGGRRLQIRLGRQVLAGGVTRFTQLDGAVVTWRSRVGAGLTVHGGVPVTPRFGVDRGDAQAGLRLFYAPTTEVQAGVSFVHVQDDGRSARQDLGIDLRVQAHRSVALTGYVDFSTLERRLAEADVALTWQPRSNLDVRIDYRRQAPDLFIPRSSIFSVFSMASRDEGGGALYLRVVPRLRLAGDYHAFSDPAGVGHRGTGRVMVHLGPAWELSLGSELSGLDLPSGNGYLRARLFATYRILPTLTATVDADTYRLSQPVNGTRLSVTGAATIGWSFRPGWRALVSAVADTTPLVERRFELMAKLAYNHVFRFREQSR